VLLDELEIVGDAEAPFHLLAGQAVDAPVVNVLRLDLRGDVPVCPLRIVAPEQPAPLGRAPGIDLALEALDGQRQVARPEVGRSALLLGDGTAAGVEAPGARLDEVLAPSGRDERRDGRCVARRRVRPLLARVGVDDGARRPLPPGGRAGDALGDIEIDGRVAGDGLGRGRGRLASALLETVAPGELRHVGQAIAHRSYSAGAFPLNTPPPKVVT